MRTNQQRLEDIHDCISAIRRYTADGRTRFDSDELVRVWCLRQIEVIGEAVAHLSPELRERYPEIRWRTIIGMRNLLTHGYSEVEDEELWRVIDTDIQPLSECVARMLSDL